MSTSIVHKFIKNNSSLEIPFLHRYITHSYSADCDDGDPSSTGDNDTLWNISMTLESVGITVDTSAESL